MNMGDLQPRLSEFLKRPLWKTRRLRLQFQQQPLMFGSQAMVYLDWVLSVCQAELNENYEEKIEKYRKSYTGVTFNASAHK